MNSDLQSTLQACVFDRLVGLYAYTLNIITQSARHAVHCPAEEAASSHNRRAPVPTMT